MALRARATIAIGTLLLILSTRLGAQECHSCGAEEAPPSVSSRTTIAGPGVRGRPLVLRGTVYQPDGKSPAPGVLVYAHHTNAAGWYPRQWGAKGTARRHGKLRGWALTDELGRYEFRTIVPGSYPFLRAPAHIHMTVKEPDRVEYAIDDVMFDNDPELTAEFRARLRGKGGSGVVRVAEQGDGSVHAVRNIVLWRGDAQR